MTTVPGETVTAELVWRRPSPRLWRARLTLLAVLAVPAGAAAIVGAALNASAPRTTAVVVVTVLAIGSLAAALYGRYRSWGWAEREDDLLVTRGLLVRRLSVVPYGRMQVVDVTAGPIDRLFRLSTVQLHTAAAATDARVPGLARDDAERLRDRLTALGESRAAGL